MKNVDYNGNTDEKYDRGRN